MKNLLILFITALSVSAVYSQEKELENFKKELNLYIDFTLGKITSLPINESNHTKLMKKVDDAFKKFVLQEDSYQYDKLRPAKDSENEKFLSLDGRIVVYTKSFILNSKPYVVYSYKSASKMNYCIKDIEMNTIVHEGNSKCSFIDNMYGIDDTHVLLIEKNGDFNSSRSAMVLSTKKNPWVMIKGFEGNAFGQVPGEYFTKKYVQKRYEFQLECEMDFTLTAAVDVNKISFDPKTKTLSYKQYFENKRYKIITAKWENERFILDDYNVSENLHESGVSVPR